MRFMMDIMELSYTQIDRVQYCQSVLIIIVTFWVSCYFKTPNSGSTKLSIDLQF